MTELTWDKMTKLLAGAAGAAAGLLGQWDASLTILAALMVIDYLTGLLCAWRGRSPKTEGGGVSSRAGFDGLVKTAYILAVVLVATLLDRAVGSESAVFQTAATLYYIANEGISILENTSLMGVPYPRLVRGALEALREKGDGADGGP